MYIRSLTACSAGLVKEEEEEDSGQPEHNKDLQSVINTLACKYTTVLRKTDL